MKKNVLQILKSTTVAAGRGNLKPSETANSPNLAQELSEIKQMLLTLIPVRGKVDELSRTTQEIKLSVEVTSEKYDEIMRRQMEQEKALKEIGAKVRRLEESKTDDCEQLRQEVNRLEQYTRLNNLEIHGVKVTQHEDLHGKFCEIADRLGLAKPEIHQIEALHRLPSKPGKIPLIIVRFANRRHRNEWLKNKHRLRTGVENRLDVEEIYIDENMTSQNKRLFFLSRKKVKEGKGRFAWHKDGLSFVRKSEGSPAIRIHRDSDLDTV
ncbi:uncharacterized protein LOC135370523 [Ornithodoros turicata]|uniref:uncharacterized protein LOC135370523 n=1 Tax=Ornithodoros turicata TaxID=34597 RepID=UPI00313A2940